MEIAESILKGAEAQEKAVAIMQRCQTPEEVRIGLLQVARLMSEEPGQETLVRSLRVAAQPGELHDYQVLQLRQTILQEFPRQAAFLRQTAKEFRAKFGKRWWEFWK